MDYAGRFNSFVLKGQDVFDAIEAYKNIPGITHLEFNYPEHIQPYGVEHIKAAMGNLKVNGLAVRWRDIFAAGDLTNPDPALYDKAVHIVREATDICLSLGGKVITLWLENDGFDYPFQMDYEHCWKQMVNALQDIADYCPQMKYSIEYKPFEERNFALIDSMGMTLYLLERVGRPNMGCTLDFCHMLMKHDSPSCGLALAASRGKLFGLHMNDGYGFQDSGLIFGTVNFALAAEFIYYLKRYGYQGVVFFDTFPIREEARAECRGNIKMFEAIADKVDRVGIEYIREAVSKRDGITSQQLILELLR